MRVVQNGAEALLAFTQIFRSLLVISDVAQYRTAHDRALGIFRGGGLNTRPELEVVPTLHLEFAYLRRTRFKEFFAVKIVDVLVFLDDEPCQRLRGQSVSRHSQQGGSGEVGLHDQTILAEGEVADRRQFVEFEVALPQGLNLRLRPPQLLILHLQFDLVHPQLVEQPLGFLWG